LVTTTSRAAKALGRKTIVVSGGVAANQALRDRFETVATRESWRVLFPPKGLNTDNGAMIALAGFVRAARGDVVDSFVYGVEPYWALARG
jgi:N6-L-threonylcarbamoyladenine synthase